MRGIWVGLKRVRPREGWLPLLLLLAVVTGLVTAVLDATWVPEDGVVIWAAVGGVLLGSVLAKRPLSALPAWILLVIYGSLIPGIVLANLWPSLRQLTGGWQPLRQFWLQNGALFLDRVGSWITAVSSGGSSQETVVFALGLGIITFLLIAFASWQLFRHARPFTGLLPVGLGLAFNGYFSGIDIWWMALFIGLAALLTAVMHIITLEAEWDEKQVDYSDEVRLDLFMTASVIAIFLLIVAMVLPSFSVRRLVAAFQEQPAVQQAGTALERAFGGVESSGGSQPAGQDGIGGRGVLPRDYLLGDAPELYETVVMTAVVQSEANMGGIHWRALSYDVYTGRGWALSEERTEQRPANTAYPLPSLAATATVSQTVFWLQDGRLVRYSLGQPTQFNQETEAIWRGQTDLVRVQGEVSPYTVQSQFSVASPQMLRETAVANIDPTILARYTPLPENIPQRVHNLAQEVAGQMDNPYDQAIALEQFLRQYPYSLSIEGPPPDSDPVDYFLFELQVGYCDYYASSMVVMARSLGLPARLGIGFLAQPADANGVQTIQQINGHSWAEIYFDGYGWIEFEPTAAFASPHAVQNEATADQIGTSAEAAPFPEEELPPLPPVEVKRPFPWNRLPILAVAATLIGWFYWRNRRPAGQDVVVWSYGRLQKSGSRLGLPPTHSLTPQEYAAALQGKLAGYGRFAWLSKLIQQLQPNVAQLTALYSQQVYAKNASSGEVTAKRIWDGMKRPLWLLRIVRHFKMPSGYQRSDSQK
ncbi:FIG001454: Transglutaminase-like enzymes, putative cysteine proteases [hydrothermal vent metagenome]|uniref:FIG001454: Transglutaminase-like enzymes, putative cysteine proteases n=1 Tax=hydrothermal vent metagenome TaxID=652676 RepID=A0A3B0UQF1_9ZZZZ